MFVSGVAVMNFISRIGLGNLAVIVALAAVPLVALALALLYNGESQNVMSAEQERPASSERAP
jgi:hypothetical protein